MLKDAAPSRSQSIDLDGGIAQEDDSSGGGRAIPQPPPPPVLAAKRGPGCPRKNPLPSGQFTQKPKYKKMKMRESWAPPMAAAHRYPTRTKEGDAK